MFKSSFVCSILFTEHMVFSVEGNDNALTRTAIKKASTPPSWVVRSGNRIVHRPWWLHWAINARMKCDFIVFFCGVPSNFIFFTAYSVIKEFTLRIMCRSDIFSFLCETSQKFNKSGISDSFNLRYIQIDFFSRDTWLYPQFCVHCAVLYFSACTCIHT